MQVQKSKYGTYLTDNEIKYRKELITETIYCPISLKQLSVLEGEIIYCGGEDHFISNEGVDKLIGIFGEKFIQERMITYD